MIGILQQFRGYLRIKVWGFSPERFMNLCSNKDILLWNIVHKGDAYYMNISLKSFYRLRPIARKTGIRVAILQRYGLPFFVPVLFQRKVFCIGLFLTLLFWMWSSLHIWAIEVEGNFQITEDVFEDFLEESDIRVGMRKDSLDIETLEKEIRKSFPQVTWTSAKLSGTRLLIEIKENDAPIAPSPEDSEGGSNLIAEYPGTIESIIVRSGVPRVAIGDTVEAGTVLVEGSVPVYNDDSTVREYQYVHADADITILHERTYTAELPSDYIKKEYTGRVKSMDFLRVGNKDLCLPQIRLSQEGPFLVYDSVVKVSRPEFFEEFSIPIAFGTKTYREYLNVEYEYSEEEAQSLLNAKIVTFLSSLEEKGVQIIEKDVKIDTSDNGFVITGVFYVREKAGISVKIESPESALENIGETETNE